MCTVGPIYNVWSPVIVYLKSVGMAKVIGLLWHTASSGLPRGFLTCTRYCACTHDGHKVINTTLVVVLSYELNIYFIWVMIIRENNINRVYLVHRLTYIHTQKFSFDRDSAHGQPARRRAKSTSIDNGPRNSPRAVTTLSVFVG